MRPILNDHYVRHMMQLHANLNSEQRRALPRPRKSSSLGDLDAKDHATAAGLRYVTDRSPGLTRERRGDGFTYFDAAGKLVRDPALLQRIKSIVIPPAWTEVWICPDGDGHIQAVGRDAAGRKQYRYHNDWRSTRDETKFDRMLVFGAALPRLRLQVSHDLGLPGLPREKVLAAVVRLMELTLARVGNVEYARENGSFGLTTLQNRHMRIKGGQIELDFRAKSGQRHYSVVTDRRLAQILKRCRDLPGSELFQYVDEANERRSIDSKDLNGYLRAISGEDITAKDFRTWAATNLALLEIGASESAPSKRQSAEIVRRVAAKLGNTPAICRKSYIHPGVLAGYLDGTIQPMLAKAPSEAATNGSPLLPIERVAMKFIADNSRRAA